MGSDASAVVRWVTRVGVVGAGLLALGSFGLSFRALSEFAASIGLAADMAWVYPLIVDGFIVMATFAAVVMRARHLRSRIYVWSLLTLFGGISIAGNALHALHAPARTYDVWLAAVGSAVPPVALLLASHLLVMMIAEETPRANVERVRTDVLPIPATVVRSQLAEAQRRDPMSPSSPDIAPAVELETPYIADVATEPPVSVDDELGAWVVTRESAGQPVTAGAYSEATGVSVRTAQRRLSAWRAERAASEAGPRLRVL